MKSPISRDPPYCVNICKDFLLIRSPYCLFFFFFKDPVLLSLLRWLVGFVFSRLLLFLRLPLTGFPGLLYFFFLLTIGSRSISLVLRFFTLSLRVVSFLLFFYKLRWTVSNMM